MIRPPAKYPLDGYEIPLVETDHYGVLPAPRDFSELAALLDLAIDGFSAPEGWRGQPNINWKVESTAVRRIKKALAADGEHILHNLTTLEEQVGAYEQRLLDDARLKGYGRTAGKDLEDLELLACLQHHGAATRLIDFTRNVFVALWFACRTHPNEYGLLLGSDIHSDSDRCQRINKDVVADLPIEELIRIYQQKVLVWEPLHLFERMRVQQSVFFFGYTHDGPWGNLLPNRFNSMDDSVTPQGDFFAYAISPQFKARMQPRWRSLLGYDLVTIFPDIGGFGLGHSADSNFEFDYFSNVIFPKNIGGTIS